MRAIRELWLVRHGVTEWSLSGQHTSFTDLELLPEGVRALEKLRPLLKGETFDAIYSSTSLRSRHTAEVLGFHPDEFTYDLNEWNYGEYEGLTTVEIRAKAEKDWTVCEYGCPGGESPEDVCERVDRFLASIQGKCLLFLSGHIGRVLIARFLQMPVKAGSHFVLEAGKLSKLGFEHEIPVVYGLNLNHSG